jgi:hypothetical protein
VNWPFRKPNNGSFEGPRRPARPAALACIAALTLAIGACGSAHAGGGPTDTQTTPAPRPHARFPVDESTLENAEVAGDGSVLLLYDTRSGNWVTYDLTTGKRLVAANDKDADGCGMTIARRADGVDAVIDAEITSTPARGVLPGSVTSWLVATDARSGKRLWASKIATDSADDSRGICDTHNLPEDVTRLPDTAQLTPDGAAMLFPATSGDLLVDLASGRIRNLGAGNAILIGTTVAVADGAPGDSFSAAELYDAGSGRHLGRSSAEVLLTCLAAAEPQNMRCAAAKTPDGYGFVTDDGAGLTGALGVPGRKLWHWQPKDEYGANISSLVSDGADVIQPLAIERVAIAAYSATTGHREWAVDEGDYCGTTNGKVFVEVNEQLAVLDAATGKQLSYDASQTECPQIAQGAIVEPTTDGVMAVPQRG